MGLKRWRIWRGVFWRWRAERRAQRDAVWRALSPSEHVRRALPSWPVLDAGWF